MSESLKSRRTPHRGVRAHLGALAERWFGWQQLDPASREFIAACRAQWPVSERDRAGKPLLLVHRSSWHASILNYAFVANLVAKQLGAAPASFGFGALDEKIAPLYESFGARSILNEAKLARWDAQAAPLARQMFESLKTKRDVVDLQHDGVNLGDLIYDTHLRHHFLKTVELRDPALLETIQRVLRIFFAAVDFLDAHEVAAVFTDHAVYAEGGVLSRLAIRRGIPAYHVPYNPATLIPLDPQMFHGERGNPAGRPLGAGSCKLMFPFHRFADVLAARPESDRLESIAKGRAVLEARLAGKFDPGVLPGGSAYLPASDSRLIEDTGRPRVLVTLHDFCDAPHAYRDLLFPDHYEWTCWLLERAAQTSFDWYVKPHPNIVAHDRSKAATNDAVVDELKARFPKAHFLPPSASNLQLIEEGLSALFTGYGTAGHEFAWFGVPAVNAGDNPHINFGFCHHPQSIDELGEFVDRAGELTLPGGGRDEIAQYAAGRYVLFTDKAEHPIAVLPAGFEESPENFRKLKSPEVLRFASRFTPDFFDQADAWFRKLITTGRHQLPASNPTPIHS